MGNYKGIVSGIIVFYGCVLLCVMVVVVVVDFGVGG